MEICDLNSYTHYLIKEIVDFLIRHFYYTI